MSRTTLVGLMLACLAIADWPRVRGSDLPGGMTISTFIKPSKSSNKRDRSAEYVQKTADFCLQDGGKKIVPGGVGYICRLERAEGDQALVWVQGRSLRGWAPLQDIVPVNHAESFFTKRIEGNPRDAFAFLMRGVVRYENDDLERAFADVSEAVRLDPANASGWIWRGYVWQARGRLDLALADANEAIRLDPKNSYAYMERGVFHFGMEAYEKAMSDFDQAARLGSRESALHVWHGMAYLQLKKWDRAIAQFNLATQIDAKNLEAYLMMGTAYLLQSDYRGAVATINKAIAADPRYPTAYEMRAVCSMSQGKYREALEDMNEAVRLEPGSAGHLAVRSRLCFEMGEFGQSLADLEATLRLEPNNAEANRGLAWFLACCPDYKLRDVKRASSPATRACELTGWKKATCLVTLAAVDSDNGDFDGAVKWQQKAIDLLAADDPERHEYQKVLKRYQAGKPYHRLGLLGELGLSIQGLFAERH